MQELFSIHIASDDKLWTFRTTNDQDLIDLLKDPHNWVSTVPKRPLANDFVIVFQEADPAQTGAYLIQGIDNTAAITVRMKHRVLPANFWTGIKAEIPPQRDDNGIKVPNNLLNRFRPDHLRAYTHIELGTNRDFVARLLAGAAVDPGGFLTMLADPTMTHECEEERGTGPSPTKKPLPGHRADLKPPSAGADRVDFVYQGIKGSTAPACNLNAGSCTDPVVNPQVVRVDTVMVKAY